MDDSIVWGLALGDVMGGAEGDAVAADALHSDDVGGAMGIAGVEVKG